MKYRSYGEQTRHYFTRQHTQAALQPVHSAANWRREDLERTAKEWTYQLTNRDIEELFAAVRSTRQNNLQLTEISRDRFPLKDLSRRLADIGHAVGHGIGVALIKGMPVDAWSKDDVERAYWGLGHHIGTPGAQNLQNELLGHVTDYNEVVAQESIRLYRTNANIRYHCDAADVVGLLCLQPAKSGGQSRIVSTVALFNKLLTDHPSLSTRLFQPFRLDNREGKPGKGEPYAMITPCCFDGSQLRTFYHSDYFRSIERHPGVNLDPDERFILDLYDALGDDPEYYFDMWLERGDMQFVSNHTVAHARTAYEDEAEPEKKRHLLRLWISLDH